MKGRKEKVELVGKEGYLLALVLKKISVDGRVGR